MFWMSVRRIVNGSFSDQPVLGPTRYLDVPDNATPSPAHVVPRTEWLRRVMATFGRTPSGSMSGAVTFFVHGFNNSVADAAMRQRVLAQGLRTAGFASTVIGYDWPSGTTALGYLDDRHDAKQTAMRLVNDGIRLFVAVRTPDCEVAVHVVAHSMGAYVVREAFDDADDTTAAAANWTANQVVLAAGDVSAESFTAGNASTESLYRHAYRLTNYFSRFDAPLQVSNLKRVGLSPRVGRVGLPAGAPAKGVNIDCSARSLKLKGDPALARDGGDPTHVFYFYDPKWYADLALTLDGRVDRDAMPTRSQPPSGAPATHELL
ncbi:MAG: alpha/beta hydrolase [Rhodobacteraceae bacterium]|nr:alpha/beta hydrolase [Paracoccaceae bacterium]